MFFVYVWIRHKYCSHLCEGIIYYEYANYKDVKIFKSCAWGLRIGLFFSMNEDINCAEFL